MRLLGPSALLVAAMFVACASAPAHAPPAPASEEQDKDDAGPDDSDSGAPVTRVYAPERTAPPSTKTYDEAMSTPEPLKVDDDRVHLTDNQLNGPIRSVLNGCRVSANARITIKTAVQFGRAIGVTVTVRLERPKSAKPINPQSKAGKAQAKRIARLAECVDHNVRAIVWPPSPRRDSFTTEF